MNKKKISGLFMGLLLLFNTVFVLMPNVAADTVYQISFSAEEGHSMAIDNGTLKIDNKPVEFKNGQTTVGTASCSSSTNCHILVDAGVTGYLNFNSDGAFVLYDTNGHTKYNFTPITGATVFMVESETGGQTNTSGTIDYQYTGERAEITINGAFFDIQNASGMGDETGGAVTGPIDYNWTTGKVEIGLDLLFTDRLTSLVINGETINVNKTPAQLLGLIRDQLIHYVVEVDKADTYTITSTSTRNEGEYMVVGNFLWSYMDIDKGTDDYVGNGIFELENVNWDGNDYSLQDLIDNDYGFMVWNEWENNETHQMEGGAMLPAGAVITVRLIPNAGYQLTSFTINGGEFEAGDDNHVGIYTFEVPRGNFHLGAHFTKVDNEVDAEDADEIESGAIKLGGSEESMQVGTAKLGISSVDLEPAKISNFKQAAGDYDVKTYLDIKLFNTIYKGTASESWDEQVDELEHKATITLTLADDVDGNEIVIVHEKHDGTYEIIDTVYDPVKHTLTFKTDSFSNYAIAAKTTTDSTEPASSANGNPPTGDGVMFYMNMLLVSMIGLATVFVLRKKKFN